MKIQRSGSSLGETLVRIGDGEQGRPDHQRHIVFSHGSRLLIMRTGKSGGNRGLPSVLWVVTIAYAFRVWLVATSES